MIDIKKLSAGMRVYDCKRDYSFFGKGEWSHWPVDIVEVNIEEGWVIARWNHNAPQKEYSRRGKFTWCKNHKG